jgi:predicted dinucleotide-binding enzyme
MMNIGIIGAGTVGGRLGKGLAAKGHTVKFSSRAPQGEKMRALVAEAGQRASAGRAHETVAFGDIIIVALPWTSLQAIVKSAGNWAGKTVIDATNRFGPSSSGLSAAEDLAQLIPDAKVVKAFNTIGVEHMVDPQFGHQKPTMFIAGDDAEAKTIAGKLAQELGFEVVDVGPLNTAGMLESLAQLWVTLARRDGRDIAFKLLRK